MKDLYPNREDSELLVDCILVWACIATTHDTAYFSEKCTDIQKEVFKIIDAFSVVFPDEHLKAPKNAAWPTQDHGHVASQLWLRDLPQGEEKELFKLIARGIARHDSKHFPDAPVQLESWVEFLSVLSDELQDWGRERPEYGPGARPFETRTWAMFCFGRYQYLGKFQARCSALEYIPRFLLLATTLK